MTYDDAERSPSVGTMIEVEETFQPRDEFERFLRSAEQLDHRHPALL